MAHKPHPNPNPNHRNRHHFTVCHRHPDTKTTTGLCAPCLRDRLSLLTPSTSSSAATAATAASPPPELRRCKTFYSNNNNNFSRVSYEPRRRSCDVNNGNKSLSSLFHLDDDDCNNVDHQVSSSMIESKNLGLGFSVPEIEEEDDNEIENEEIDLGFDHSNEESKTMKEFIDLEFRSQTRKPSGGSKKDLKDMVGSFYKKLRKWRKKQGFTSKRGDLSVERSTGLGEMRLESLRGRRLRDTQSEVGEYGGCGGGGRRSCDVDVDFGARVSIDYGRASIDCGALGLGFSRGSCDSDPRFSIDLGRGGSIAEGRCSFDAPRASWDGYFVGRRGTLPPPCGSGGPVVSVIENAMATVYGFDHSHRVMNEGKNKVENGDNNNNNSYSTKGFDGSSSIKEGAGVNETKLLITEKELNEWRLNSGKDDNSSESFETASKDLASVSSSSNGNYFKECRQWRKLWGLWGFLHRKKGEQCCNEEKVSTSRNGDKEARVESDRKFVRSHSTSSSRGSSSTIAGSAREVGSKPESNALVRSRSSKLSPNHFDNGLLRFYLTPLRSRRRSKLGKSRLKNAPSLARSMLR